MPDIVIDRNYVIVEGTKVLRPASIAPSAWLAWWESVVEPAKEETFEF